MADRLSTFHSDEGATDSMTAFDEFISTQKQLNAAHRETASHQQRAIDAHQVSIDAHARHLAVHQRAIDAQQETIRLLMDTNRLLSDRLDRLSGDVRGAQRRSLSTEQQR